MRDRDAARLLEIEKAIGFINEFVVGFDEATFYPMAVQARPSPCISS